MSELTPLSDAIQHVPVQGPPSLSGVMMAPDRSRASARPAPFSYERPPVVVNRRDEDAGSLLAVVVILVVAAGAFAVAFDRFHRPEGWPVGRFFMGPDAEHIALAQYALAALVGVVAFQNGRRAHRTWTGSGGGVLSTVVTAAFVGAACFAAWELVCAG